jgi:endonuclease I
MRKNCILLLLLSVSFGFSQIPAGYYDTATGSGFTLKTQLFNKISPHNIIVYGSGLWNLFQTSDVRSNGNVWDIYSTCNFVFGTVADGGNQDDGTLGTAECQRFNKEHTFPKSWFGGVNGTAMYSDAFHVMPADKKDNGMRGSLAYGMVGTASYTTSNGIKIGNCIIPNYPYNLNVFEPADEFKGDIARNYFYMATCYENLIGSWQTIDPTGSGDTVLDGSNDNVYEPWFLNMLINWHNQDPVSQKEIDRNNAIYAVQGNRNPFIDHPEYVCQIWTTACANLLINAIDFATFSLFPNPTNEHKISIISSIPVDEIQVITVDGQVMIHIIKPVLNDNSYSVENLPQGFYFLKLNSSNQCVTKKVIVN